MKTILALTILLTSFLTYADERVALIVGNNDYQNNLKLDNCVNDARAMSDLLKRAGFAVTTLEDATAERMLEALDTFGTAAAKSKVALFYYAGHGLEDEGKNYLVPTDARLETKAQLALQTISLQTVLEELNEAKVPAKILLLDCCRNMPLERGWRNARTVGGGLAALDSNTLPESTIIYFATAPGTVALDAGVTGKHSPFTEGLLEKLKTPDIHAFEALMQVEDVVYRTTQGKQRPKFFSDGATAVFRQLYLANHLKPNLDATTEANVNPTEPMTPAVAPMPEVVKPSPEENSAIAAAAGISFPSFRALDARTGALPEKWTGSSAVGRKDDGIPAIRSSATAEQSMETSNFHWGDGSFMDWDIIPPSIGYSTLHVILTDDADAETKIEFLISSRGVVQSWAIRATGIEQKQFDTGYGPKCLRLQFSDQKLFLTINSINNGTMHIPITGKVIKKAKVVFLDTNTGIVSIRAGKVNQPENLITKKASLQRAPNDLKNLKGWELQGTNPSKTWRRWVAPSVFLGEKFKANFKVQIPVAKSYETLSFNIHLRSKIGGAPLVCEFGLEGRYFDPNTYYLPWAKWPELDRQRYITTEFAQEAMQAMRGKTSANITISRDGELIDLLYDGKSMGVLRCDQFTSFDEVMIDVYDGNLEPVSLVVE